MALRSRQATVNYSPSQYAPAGVKSKTSKLTAADETKKPPQGTKGTKIVAEKVYPHLLGKGNKP